MIKKFRLTLLGAVAVAVVLAACHKDTASAPVVAPAAKPKTAPISKAGPTAAEQTAGMVEAVSQGKSPLPVELKFELAQRPKVGQSLDLNLALVAQLAASPASIRLTGTDAVAVTDGQFDIPTVEPGEVYRHAFKVTPSAEGVAVVGVTVSLKHDEITDTKAFSIPIIAER